MKIYCAYVLSESSGERSRQWFATKKEANAFQSESDDCSIELIDLGPRKSDLLKLLNKVAFHDNG